LIDAHAHFFLEGGELDPEKRSAYLKKEPPELLELARPRLGKLLRLGIIAIRDAGDKDGVGLALSKLCSRRRGDKADFYVESPREIRLLTSAPTGSRPLMPYVDSPGAGIHHRGRYGGFMAEPMEDFATPAQCVEARVKAGAGRIKLIPTGIINFKQGAVTTEPQMTREEVTALVNAARSFGKQTFAHASGDVGIERVIESGVDSVEHGYFIRADQLARMRDRQIAWVPTFAPVQQQADHADLLGWDDQVVSNLKKILDQHAASLVKARAMGVLIIAGSDAGAYGVAHGVGFLNELELMERAGLPPLAVVNAATGTPSTRLAFKEKFGQIKPGFLTRFILTRHSPMESIANLRKPKIVVFDNLVFESAEGVDPTGL